QREIEQMAPTLSGNEPDLSRDIVLLVNLGRGLNILRKESTAAAAVEFQFFNAFGQSAERAEQFVFFLAGQVEKTERTGYNQPIANRAQDNEAEHRQQDA